jgi:hypothetical protein
VAFARSATARIPIACDFTAVDCAAGNVDAAGVPELVKVEDCFAERSGLREEKQADFAPDACGQGSSVRRVTVRDRSTHKCRKLACHAVGEISI